MDFNCHVMIHLDSCDMSCDTICILFVSLYVVFGNDNGTFSVQEQ